MPAARHRAAEQRGVTSASGRMRELVDPRPVTVPARCACFSSDSPGTLIVSSWFCRISSYVYRMLTTSRTRHGSAVDGRRRTSSVGVLGSTLLQPARQPGSMIHSPDSLARFLHCRRPPSSARTTEIGPYVGIEIRFSRPFVSTKGYSSAGRDKIAHDKRHQGNDDNAGQKIPWSIGLPPLPSVSLG